MRAEGSGSHMQQQEERKGEKYRMGSKREVREEETFKQRKEGGNAEEKTGEKVTMENAETRATSVHKAHINSHIHSSQTVKVFCQMLYKNIQSLQRHIWLFLICLLVKKNRVTEPKRGSSVLHRFHLSSAVTLALAWLPRGNTIVSEHLA